MWRYIVPSSVRYIPHHLRGGGGGSRGWFFSDFETEKCPKFRLYCSPGTFSLFIIKGKLLSFFSSLEQLLFFFFFFFAPLEQNTEWSMKIWYRTFLFLKKILVGRLSNYKKNFNIFPNHHLSQLAIPFFYCFKSEITGEIQKETQLCRH